MLLQAFQTKVCCVQSIQVWQQWTSAPAIQHSLTSRVASSLTPIACMAGFMPGRCYSHKPAATEGEKPAAAKGNKSAAAQGNKSVAAKGNKPIAARGNKPAAGPLWKTSSLFNRLSWPLPLQILFWCYGVPILTWLVGRGIIRHTQSL